MDYSGNDRVLLGFMGGVALLACLQLSVGQVFASPDEITLMGERPEFAPTDARLAPTDARTEERLADFYDATIGMNRTFPLAMPPTNELEAALRVYARQKEVERILELPSDLRPAAFRHRWECGILPQLQMLAREYTLSSAADRQRIVNRQADGIVLMIEQGWQFPPGGGKMPPWVREVHRKQLEAEPGFSEYRTALAEALRERGVEPNW